MINLRSIKKTFGAILLIWSLQGYSSSSTQCTYNVSFVEQKLITEKKYYEEIFLVESRTFTTFLFGSAICKQNLNKEFKRTISYDVQEKDILGKNQEVVMINVCPDFPEGSNDNEVCHWVWGGKKY